MDILKEKELNKCYAIIQLQTKTIEELSERIKHLEKLLTHEAQILNFNKE